MDDPEEIKEEIEHQKGLIKDYRKRLRVLERQAAVFGLQIPPYIQIEIDEITQRIETCETKIEGYELQIRAPRITQNRRATGGGSAPQRHPWRPARKYIDRVIEIAKDEGFISQPLEDDNIFTFVGTKNLFNAGDWIDFYIANADMLSDDDIKAAERRIRRVRPVRNIRSLPLVITCYLYENVSPILDEFRDIYQASFPTSTNRSIWLISRRDSTLYTLPTTVTAWLGDSSSRKANEAIRSLMQSFEDKLQLEVEKISNI